jgi:hypothetical protein
LLSSQASIFEHSLPAQLFLVSFTCHFLLEIAVMYVENLLPARLSRLCSAFTFSRTSAGLAKSDLPENAMNEPTGRIHPLNPNLIFPTIALAAGQGILLLVFLLTAIGPLHAQDAKAQYPKMAPIDQYRIANPADEIAMARSAAPPSISSDADVLVLGAHGYETAAKGKNGFACIVERSWANNFEDTEFWNPKVRGPICFNPASVRSVLPAYLKRTDWILSGLSKDQVLDRVKAAVASNAITPPELGSMCYMLSKQGYLNDAAGHWHPHLMFFLPHTTDWAWRANLAGSPVFSSPGDPDPYTVFFAPVLLWSDGTPGPTEMKH